RAAVRTGDAGPVLPGDRGGRPAVRPGEDEGVPGIAQPRQRRGGAGMNGMERKTQNDKRKTIGTSGRFSVPPFSFCVLSFAFLAGWQQKMAEQPAIRTYAETKGLFAHGQSARPLEAGTVYRGQKPADDPLVSGLTPKGRTPRKAYPDELLSQ